MLQTCCLTLHVCGRPPASRLPRSASCRRRRRKARRAPTSTLDSHSPWTGPSCDGCDRRGRCLGGEEEDSLELLVFHVLFVGGSKSGPVSGARLFSMGAAPALRGTKCASVSVKVFVGTGFGMFIVGGVPANPVGEVIAPKSDGQRFDVLGPVPLSEKHDSLRSIQVCKGAHSGRLTWNLKTPGW